jgi:hypothetical protein
MSKLNSDRDIEKVIENIRLANIEKDIRSSTARLDERVLFPVEEINNPRAAEREAAAKQRKVLERRGHAGDMRVQGAIAKAKLEAKGIEIKDAVDVFENEEKIWKSKSHNGSYLTKRKFNNPELHAYAQTLNPSAKREIDLLCKEKLFLMSQELRVNNYMIKIQLNNKIYLGDICGIQKRVGQNWYFPSRSQCASRGIPVPHQVI